MDSPTGTAIDSHRI